LLGKSNCRLNFREILIVIALAIRYNLIMTSRLRILFFISVLLSSCAREASATPIPRATNPVSTPSVAVTSAPRIQPNDLTFIEFFSGA